MPASHDAKEGLDPQDSISNEEVAATLETSEPPSEPYRGGVEELNPQDAASKEKLAAALETSEPPRILDSSLDPRCDVIEELELQDGASNETATTALETPKTPSVMESPWFGLSTSDAATFVRQKDRWTQTEQHRLKNSLLMGVGLLELANAGDFAANVWNQVPVPHFAQALMALGGTMALVISLFAFRDAQLSRHNIRQLREERQFLWTQKADLGADIGRNLECQLDINFRELGTEYVERLGMDIAMGFGAIMVATGTFLAIGGANHKIYLASNLLSGYIGNAPVALFGLGNAAFSMYVFRRAHRHSIAVTKELSSDVFRRRIRRIKTHAAINAVMGVIAGAASLVTATHWEGYPVLLPCIISAIVCNYIWRNGIGYERPLVQQKLMLNKSVLLEELNYIVSARKILKEAPSEALSRLVPNAGSLASVLEFITNSDLFGDFSLHLLENNPLATSIFGHLGQEVRIDVQSLLAADKELHPQIHRIAQETLLKKGPTRFKYRERYVLELLGCYMCSSGTATALEKC